MIWIYTVAESGELQARDADSLEELRGLGEEVGWFWIDFMDPSDEELKIVSGLLEESEITEDISRHKIFSHPERAKDYLLFSIPQALFKNGLKTFPIYVFTKDNSLLTIRNGYSSRSIKNTLKTFEDCVGKICTGPVNSSFILGRLFHETSNENLNAVMAFRGNVDEIEQKTFENPADKNISPLIFAAKREISAFERILWAQKELMFRVSEGVIPTLRSSEEIRSSLNHPINNISRELSILDSHNKALDNILSLQKLGTIHRFEKSLVRLGIIALVISAIMIILKIDIFKLLF
ncbi:MAG: magnesium transporter CorA family protein [Candidatus Bathyarchaeota archaeon]|nr:MAG: magnesium transporter CorA family protein [Candidatus Bathyarchaeota archaeon]